MAQQIKLEILIDGSLEVTPFTSLSVSQKINDHHQFELRFNQDIKKGDDKIFISKYQDYLGKSIAITFGADLYKLTVNHTDKVFKGIITDIQMNNDTYDQGSIIVKGYSTSIALETMDSCSIHLEKSVEQIVSKLTKDIPSNILSFNIKPVFKKAIPYIVQYKESTFNFIKRLAFQYGEWLFYDGKDFFFGKPQKFPEVELKYPIDISHLNFSMGIKPLNYTGNTYSLEKVDKKEVAPNHKESINGIGSYGNVAVKSASDLFLLSANAPTVRWENKAELEEEVKIRKATEAASLITLEADSDHPGVHVGTIVSVTKEDASLGKFFVVEAFHTTDGNGNYTNSFKAIPSELAFLPPPSYIKPFTDTQVGKVIDNYDPDKLGRIKVQLTWQADEDKSSLPWIDVITPSAGALASGDKNRGFHFTPEIDDYVVVGFSDNDPSKPLVMGSISTHDNRDSGSNKNNFEKVITTRSGNTIYFRDLEDNKEQEIRVETDKSNFISILVKNGDGMIEVQSTKDVKVVSTKTVHVESEKITIDCKDFTVKASNNIKMQAGNNFNLDVTNAVSVKGDGKITLDSQGDVKLSSLAKVELAGMDVNLKGQKGIKGDALQLDLAGSAMTNIKGGIVKIN
jgi:hypothetical protein